MNEVLIFIYDYRCVSILLVIIVASCLYYLKTRKPTVPLAKRAWRNASIGMIVATIFGIAAAETVGRLREHHLTQHMTAALPAYAMYLQTSGHAFLDVDTPLNHPTLMKMRETRETWLKTNPEITDIYTLRRSRNGTIIPILQDEPQMSSDGMVPAGENRIVGGSSRPDLVGKLNDLFDSGQTIVTHPQAARHGYSISAFYPLFDSQGRVEAAIAVDTPADRWLADLFTYRALTLCLFGAIAFIQFFFAVHAIQLHEEHAQREKRSRDTHHLAALVNCLQDGVISTDLNGIIASWNPAAERIYGYNAEEIIGKSMTILFPPDRANDKVRIISEITQKNGVAEYETARLRKDRTRIEVSVSGSAIHNEAGAMIGFCFAVRDITEQKRIAQRMKDNADELERTNRELKNASAQALAATRTKSEFLANMSHEIRTPMTAILGYSDIIASPDSTQPERAEAAQVIRRNGQHLMSLINDILDISKIEAGKLEPVLTPYSPPRLLSEVLSVMRVQAIERHLSLKINYETPIPDNLNLDPTRIRQIIMNLVANAIKFTENGGVSIAVRYRRDEHPVVNESGNMSAGTFEISVADTGIGIDKEKMQELFQPFWQADNSMTRKFGGAGLGLTISHRLAQILGGTITVDSRPGSGSIFTLSVHVEEIPGAHMIIPSEAVHHLDKNIDDPNQPATATNNGEKPKPLANRRILLVEDGPDNQRLISHVLKMAGATVTVAANGQIGVDLAWEARRDNSPYDVILMDMQMPILDGYGATRELRDRGYKGPIIALTAHAMADDRQKCIQAGCDDYATKPIDKNRLLKLMLEYINGKPAAATT